MSELDNEFEGAVGASTDIEAASVEEIVENAETATAEAVVETAEGIDATEVAEAAVETASLDELAESADFDLSDLGSDLGVEDVEEAVADTEDYTGFAKGFPSWDLLPPKL